ncbi:MAG: helix-turn-helix domain-containing protein, partial [Streptosporangiaceae bacterium]
MSGRSREIQAGARRLLAENRGHQLAETRKQLGLAQKDIAAALGVSIARISQIEHGEVTSFEVIARYVEALGGHLNLVADFGDRTVRLPVSPWYRCARRRTGGKIAGGNAPGRVVDLYRAVLSG